MKAGLAVFVKTPGYSPVKTRLAQTIGTAQAEAFYRLSVRATEAVIRGAVKFLPELKPYWAVAEKPALSDSQWKGFETLEQGEGGLGDRLSRIYDQLLADRGAAFLMGADSPQLDPAILVQAYELLKSKRQFLLGPAEDGGFYLFGGAMPLSQLIWSSVPYSIAQTAEELISQVSRVGQVQSLPTLFDVDTVAELRRLGDELSKRAELLPEQRDLRDWVKKVVPT